MIAMIQSDHVNHSLPVIYVGASAVCATRSVSRCLIINEPRTIRSGVVHDARILPQIPSLPSLPDDLKMSPNRAFESA
jgi:hypothetical protein